jgi:hypothetical protein
VEFWRLNASNVRFLLELHSLVSRNNVSYVSTQHGMRYWPNIHVDGVSRYEEENEYGEP